MKLSRVCIRNPVGTSFFMLTVAVLGLLAIRELPIAYWPKASPPFLVLQTAYPGVAPEDIEEEVTKPLERVVSTVDNLYEVESSSIEGMSQLVLRFNWGTDIATVKRDVREKIDGARRLLPRDAEPTAILALDVLLPAPMEIAVSSDRYSQGDVRAILRDKIANRLLRLGNVAAVDIRGGRNKVVRIEADPDKLLSLGIPLATVERVVAAENVNQPGGTLLSGSKDLILRTFNQYNSLQEIRDVIVARRGETPVHVGDIATVRLVDDEEIGIARINGVPALAMSIRQTSGGNTVALVDEVNHELARIRHDFPDLRFQVIKDDSDFIRKAIRSVSTNVLLGALVASFLIYLFLGSVRNTLIIVLSIPVSLFATFIAMRSLGLTINTISLGGLALGVGMIVDASVVVLENIFYRLSVGGGNDRIETTANAVSEVGLAITASVLTSIVVFLPLAFTRGLVVFLLGELSLTVVFALTFSLLVSLTLIPMLSHKIMATKPPRFFLPRLWSGMIDLLVRVYRPVVTLTAKTPLRALITLVLVTLSMAVPILLVRNIDVELVPPMDQGEFRLDLELPRGTSLPATSGIAADIEQRLLSMPEVAQVYSVVGLTAFYNQPQSHIAFMDVKLRRDERGRRIDDTQAVLAEARRMLKGYPDAQIRLRLISVTEGMIKQAVDVRVLGPDLDTLRTLGAELVDSLRSMPGVVNVRENLGGGKPELVLRVNRDEASAWGLSPAEIASRVRIAVKGRAVTRYSAADGNLYDVVVTLPAGAVRHRDDLSNLPLQTPSGTVIPLKAVVDFQERPSPAEIRRVDQERFIAVTGDVAGGAIQRDVRSRIEEFKRRFTLPREYRWKRAEISRAITESFQSLGVALLLAVFLVYVVMAAQFNSVWQPLVIASAIPFSLFGAVLGLLVFGAVININSFLGFIMLSGIVVNNGILLVDFINKGRREMGLGRFDAIREAGVRRLRPILMTSLTTIAGMLFIALGLGEGSETLVPLSAVVIGGLAMSTALTLVVVPSIYTLFDAILGGIGRRLRRGK